MAAKKGLGRGLSALLSDSEQEYDFSFRDETSENKETATSGETPRELPIAQIDPNVNQPRKNFDEVALGELANSIRIHGVISPIIVVMQPNGRYMIIAGERRWRASKRAGLLTRLRRFLLSKIYNARTLILSKLRLQSSSLWTNTAIRRSKSPTA